ncbi:peptidase M4 family protein [Tatlockia micdadei]|uniref:M4 family metallopeptidase n=1 Tax=Legionella micdadei TaxID=451 RepID=UPI00156EA461|nr:M4 family metallopeptidase [Legionella micdadei]NSL19404.1 peptidase M4 family protein [Legionella micdadei]
MIKKIAYAALISLYSTSWAATYMNLHHAPFSKLKQFSFLHQTRMPTSSAANANELKPVSQTQQDKLVITRYQQLYKGIPIIGAQVTVSQNPNHRGLADNQVNGHLFDDIQLNTNPAFSPQRAIQLAKNHYFNQATLSDSPEEKSELQIRATKENQNQLQLTYFVSFKSMAKDKPEWPSFIIDAQTGAIINQWNNLQYYTDSGPGGNEKVHEYWYGQDDLPGLEVSQEDQTCVLDDDKVTLVNLKFEWDWPGFIRTPYRYPCNNNVEDFVNGAYSVGNDAYYFGHIIVDLYKNWYGLNALQDDKGNPQKLIMRVHFGSSFDNAFWDGETMSFGDGSFFYPLVSLDVAGHEVAHGFTQQHANLEYHDESGALNESFSDMAGQAARAYLLETVPKLYNKVHLTPNEVTWTIGETLIPPSLPITAVRFLDLPSLDGDSADCVDKKMARTQKSICAISYPELLAYTESKFSDSELDKQSFLVHTASGVFNRAFYLMAKQLGIKKAFHAMVVANTKYWTPTTDFSEGACGVTYAAKDLNLNPDVIETAFRKVGIDTTHCI